MKISHLTIRNFLKLRDVDIRPGHTNAIVGRNKQGKTSILKAIQAAMDGKLDESVIRNGAEHAEVVIEMDDLIVRRTVTSKGAHLDVSNTAGMSMKSPQKFLDGIIGSFSFNPVEFFNLKPAEQKKYLLAAIPLRITKERMDAEVGAVDVPADFDGHALDVIEEYRKTAYAQRTAANAEVARKRKAIDELSSSLPDGFDPKKYDEAQVNALREVLASEEKQSIEQRAHEEKVASIRKQRKDVQDEIDRLVAKRDTLDSELAEAEKVEFHCSSEEVLIAARETVRTFDAMRSHVDAMKRIDSLRSELSDAVKEAERLDAIVKKLATELPEKVLSEAKLPIDGLALSDGGITLGGVSLDNLSTSEQIRFALSVVRAMNSTFKVILIDGIEALDRETYAQFVAEIENDDYQYFVSRVDGEPGKDTYVVEDGAVKPA